MPPVLHKATGRVINVAPEELQKALASGQYELQGRTAFEDAPGAAVALSPEDAAAQLNISGGAAPQSAAAQTAAAEDAQLEQMYGDGVGNTLLAGAAGVARGATLGLSDLVAKGILDDEGEFALEQLRLRNEIASTAGEIGGALAPALLSGGTGVLGAAARATPAGLATGLARSAAGRIAGESAAATVLRGAVEDVVEGGAFGLGSQITNSVLHDDPFTVDALASSIGLGAVLGGAGGAVLGGLGVAGRRIARVETPLDEMAANLGKIDEASRAVTKEEVLEGLSLREGISDDIASTFTDFERKQYQNALKQELRSQTKAAQKEAQDLNLRAKQDYDDSVLRRDEAYNEELTRAQGTYNSELEKVRYENSATKLARKERDKLLDRLAREEASAPKLPEKEIADLEKRVRDLDRQIFRAENVVTGEDAYRVDQQFKQAGDLMRRKGAAVRAGSDKNAMPAEVYDELTAKLFNKGLRGGNKGKLGRSAGALDELHYAKLEAEEQLAKLRDSHAKAVEAHQIKLDKGMKELLELDELAKRELAQEPGKFVPPTKKEISKPGEILPKEVSISEEFAASAAQKIHADRLSRTAGRKVSELGVVRQRLQTRLGKDMDLGMLFTKSPGKASKVIDDLDKYVKLNRELDELTGGRHGLGLELTEEAFGKGMAPERLAALRNMSDEAVVAALDDAVDLGWVQSLDPTAKLALKVYAARGLATSQVVKAHASNIRNFTRVAAGAYAKGVVGSATRGASASTMGGLGVMRAAAAWSTGKIVNALFAAQAVGGSVKLGVSAALKQLSRPSVRRGAIVATQSILSQHKFGDNAESKADKHVGRARIKEIQAAIVNPQQTLRRMQIALLPISLQNPAVGEKVSASLMTRLQYISERMPRLLDSASLRRTKGEPVPSSAELARWSRVIRAAENPMTVLEDLKNQNLHIDAVETVKVLYPSLFAKMQEELVLQMAETNFKAPYQARHQLSVMFDVPLDYTHTPVFVSFMQQQYAERAQAAPQPRGSLGSPQPGAELTQAQRLAPK